MQVTCPNCGARYAVDPLAIGPNGRTVQCVRCSHRWQERPIAPAAVAPPPPRPAPDFVIRPSTYSAGLPALAAAPAAARWGRWAAGIAVALVVLGTAAWAFRHEILEAMPPDWRGRLPLDDLRVLFARQ